MSDRRLTLVRHAKSSWRFANLDDFRRPLNRRGLRDCLRMPELVAAQVPKPDLLLASDAVRTVQTCQALADAYELYEDRIQLDGALYLAGYRDLLKRLRVAPAQATHVMLVGHNPGLSELCNYLLPAPQKDLPTFAVASMLIGAQGWPELARGGARLDRLLLPKELLHGAKE